MSQAVSLLTGRTYGLARVARVWQLSRATVYRHRATAAAAAPAGPVRRGPVGACSDTVLLEHIRAQILGSRLHGEGYRKIWARHALHFRLDRNLCINPVGGKELNLRATKRWLWMLNEDCLNIRLGDYLDRRRDPREAVADAANDEGEAASDDPESGG